MPAGREFFGDDEPRSSGKRDVERIALERRLLEEARADIEAGLFIPDEEVDAWLDALVAGDPVTIPGEIPHGRKQRSPT